MSNKPIISSLKRTRPANQPETRPFKRLRFLDHKYTQTEVNLESNHTGSPTTVLKSAALQVNPTTQPNPNNSPLKKAITTQSSVQHPYQRALLELQISPTPEIGKTVYYSYEYSWPGMDEDWENYLILYDDVAYDV